MRDKLDKYTKGIEHYTPIMNIMINNRSKDWYAELGKYIDDTIDITKVPDLAFVLHHKPKPNKDQFKKIKDFGLFTNVDQKFDSDTKMFYFHIASTFITTSLDEESLKKMFGEPILHSEFGEGFDGDWLDDESDDEQDIFAPEQHSYASYFVNVGGTNFHIGYDHRGTKVEIGLDKKFDYHKGITELEAEKCLQALKDLVDLFKQKAI